MAKTSEFKDRSVEELKETYLDLSKDLFRLKNEFKLTKKSEKPHLMRAKKRDRARVLTFLRQKGGSVTN
ncbi:MAG: 50S ribosomal protein L29 [Rhabdochlamydiaceae bacterium]|nr:50S ribosomal protein L29 [Rhabdochlamydiaceae bacterium]